MLRSMTGFGEGRAENERYEVSATLRSVNHRFLDVSVRMPEEHRSLESGLLQRLRKSLERGRVELRLALKIRAGPALDIEIDEAAAGRYLEAAKRLQERGGVDGGLASGDLLRLPGVVSVGQVDDVFSQEDRELVERATDEALERLLEERAREGRELTGVLRRATAALVEVVASLEAMRPSLQEDLRARLQLRLADLTGAGGIDEDRVAQEVALLVDRADVQEEIDRLKLHVEHFAALLDQNEAAGKRLDFLAQEILRELNTVGSKCRSSEATQLVLDGKVLCEQLREQVQNVE